eukprot:TRINITY_DN4104_c0_g1_i1.p1 TRINITY_DN4104_c0_g1~~TRINITY_DN4104_c0_g1_i1.p1  ORF type:complete len:129 (-),score=2.06 TRINITY_DN4104_c0_g1_i1:495-881(-)
MFFVSFPSLPLSPIRTYSSFYLYFFGVPLAPTGQRLKGNDKKKKLFRNLESSAPPPDNPTKRNITKRIGFDSNLDDFVCVRNRKRAKDSFIEEKERKYIWPLFKLYFICFKAILRVFSDLEPQSDVTI